MMPEIILGYMKIPSFFLVISLSLSVLVVYLSKRVDEFSKDRKIAFDIALILMIAGFLGGRLMHVFYEEWPFYQKYPEQIFYFWQGGFVFFGGLATSWLAIVIYCKIKKQIFLEWADFFAPLLSLSHAFGRIGCLLSGCCYGIKCEIPWSLEGRHPTALYMFIGEFLIYFFILFYEQKVIKSKRTDLVGAVFMKWILLHSILRLYVEYYRDDFRGNFYELPIFGHVSISQVISLTLITISLFYFLSRLNIFKKSALNFFDFKG